MNYYYSTDGSEVAGPSSIAEMRQLLNSGVLPPNTQVCAEGQQTWQVISEVITPSAKTFHAGTTPSSSATTEGKLTSEPPEQKKRFLSIILPAIAVIIVSLGFFLWQRGAFAPRPTVEIERLREELERLKAAQASTPPTLVLASPTPKAPLLSEASKTRILAFLEKASKLRAMTDQGVNLDDFKAQLSEVKGTWDSISTIGLPEQLQTEAELLRITVLAWALAHEIWSVELSANTQAFKNPGENLLFTVQAGRSYRTKLNSIKDSLQTGSISPPTSPDFADSGAFELEIVNQFKDMTNLIATGIEQSQHGHEIDNLEHSFQEAIAKFDQNLPDGFSKSFSFNDLQGVPDLVTKISDQRRKILGGSLGPVATAEAGVEMARSRQAITKAFIPIFKKALDTPSQIDSTKIVRPHAAVQWCFVAAASALDAAKNGISQHLKDETSESR